MADEEFAKIQLVNNKQREDEVFIKLVCSGSGQRKSKERGCCEGEVPKGTHLLRNCVCHELPTFLESKIIYNIDLNH